MRAFLVWALALPLLASIISCEPRPPQEAAEAPAESSPPDVHVDVEIVDDPRVPEESPPTGSAPPDFIVSEEPVLLTEDLTFSQPPGEDYSIVRVFYGTNHNEDDTSDPSDAGKQHAGKLSFGSCRVSIPPGHKRGELEKPSIWKLEFGEDPSKHVVLLAVAPLEREDFLKSLRSVVESSDGKDSFVFIHGYNTKFEDAAKRTAQIAYDLLFDGPPLFYSWPAHGDLDAYLADEDNACISIPYLVTFLRAIANESDAEGIHVVAHSMGNRVLTEALIDLHQEDPAARARFREIILTAPDIDARIFEEQIAPKLKAGPSRVTLYASSNDKALKASHQIHQNPRAGESGDHLLILPDVFTIDATEVPTDLLGHSHFAAELVLRDLFEMFRDHQHPDERSGLKRIDVEAGSYWQFD